MPTIFARTRRRHRSLAWRHRASVNGRSTQSALAYQGVADAVRRSSELPMVPYSVSGEDAMVKAAPGLFRARRRPRGAWHGASASSPSVHP